MTELWRRGAFELADMIKRREVSSREVVEAHINRIEALNPKINAVTRVLESALADADAADLRSNQGPLHGVPFSVKENIDVLGSPTTLGVASLVDAMPSADAPIVQRLRAAGGIPLARTNCPELAIRIDTVNRLHGRTLNPWRGDITAGGSSGGEGAAIACGMSPLGLGNDIGGSLRNPAFCNGITALKPTPGRLPRVVSSGPADWGLATQLMAVEGPMARHVADLREAFLLLAGSHIGDPDSVAVPLSGPEAPRRAALVTQWPDGSVAPAAVAAVERAGQALSAAGWTVELREPPELAAVHNTWGVIICQDFHCSIDDIAPMLDPLLARRMREIIALFDAPNVPSVSVHMERRRLRRAWSQFFVDWPLVVMPTWPVAPLAHDEDMSATRVTTDTLRFVAPANVLGLPAVAVPTGMDQGLPTGVQVYAERFREDLALQGAAVIEAALGRITPIDPQW